MSLAAKLETRPGNTASHSVTSVLGTRRIAAIAGDIVLLVTACLTIGLAVGLGVMLLVLILA